MNKPSITDWIQTVAVVIGIAAAIWEFVLTDRAEQRAQRQLMTDLILAGQDSAFLEAMEDITEHYNIYVSGKDFMKYLAKAEIFQSHYDSWAFCFDNNLCDPDLTLEYICPKVSAFNKMNQMIYKAAKKEFKFDNTDYQRLVEECAKQYPPNEKMGLSS